MAVNMFESIQEMNQYISRSDWKGLEADYEKIARSLAGEERTVQISNVDVQPFEHQLMVGLTKGIERAQEVPVKAIYFEYDLDNDWDGHLFLCEEYKPAVEADDDWACDWIETIQVGGFSAFANLYNHEFNQTAVSVGASLFLISRTVAAFGRLCKEHLDAPLSFCIGFHDQDPIFRIKETD